MGIIRGGIVWWKRLGEEEGLGRRRREEEGVVLVMAG